MKLETYIKNTLSKGQVLPFDEIEREVFVSLIADASEFRIADIADNLRDSLDRMMESGELESAMTANGVEHYYLPRVVESILAIQNAPLAEVDPERI